LQPPVIPGWADHQFLIMKKKLTTGILFCVVVLLVSGIVLFRSAIGNLLSGRVHFPDEYIGKVIEITDGQNFTIFRRLQVDGKIGNHNDKTVFKVKFRFKNLSLETNKRLSIMPTPFLIGMKDFREKIWTINDKTSEFQGIYQWSSKEAAERYPQTLIFKLMTKRSAPGSVSYEIIPNTDLSEYLSASRKVPL
jgi:hypothetical protein